MLNVQHADVYADFNGLAKLKTQARQNSPEALKEVAKQFEAIFLNNVLKGMREAKLADGITDSDQSKFYNDMYDQQLAMHLSGKPGVGLADLIVKQLGHDQSDNKNPELAKSISQYPRVMESPVINKTGNPVSMKAYIQDNSPFDEMTALSLKNDQALPIQSKEDFIRQLYPQAKQAAKALGVEPRVILAQAALETGWGRSLIKNSNGSNSFNLFNIKADKAWRGQQAQVPTLEFEQGIAKKVNAGFRSYSSFQESFQDYVSFIKSNPRYGDALKQVGNGERYLVELQRAGYASDPNYANKIMSIYHGNTMAQFDPETVVAMR